MTHHRDAAGLEITATCVEAVECYDRAVDGLLEYRLDAGQHAKSALTHDPEFPMGLCFRGYLLMQLGTGQIHPKVQQTLDQAKAVAAKANRREQLHVAALEQWLAGRVHDARHTWEQILLDAPSDLLALRLHHFMSFWQGARGCLRDAPAAALGRMSEATPGYGFALGMFAFGLEENGDYARAEEFGRRAVELNSDDLWAIHAVAHVLEMQCEHEAGTQWLNQPAGTWADRNPFKDHIWWHTALFWLELGDHARVLELYDKEVKVDDSGFYLDLQNAASLLMRLELLGVEVGDRWDALADLAETRMDDHQLPFTDMHFMLALVGSGRNQAAKTYLDSLVVFGEDSDSDAASVTTSLGVPIAQALLSYSQQSYAEVVAKLMPIRYELAPLGGSHAQQDLLTQILIEAALRDGQQTLAHNLLGERTMLRPGTAWALDKLNAMT